VAIVAAAIVVLAATGVISRTWWTHAHPAPKKIPSIAVLPFRPMGSNQDQYLGVAMADALISRLSNIRGVMVRPTSAVRKFTALADPVEAGRELSVEAVVEGTIQHAGDRLRVSVQLVDILHDSPKWSETFDIADSDAFSVQDRISEKVAAALLVNLNGQSSHYTENPEAQRDYVRGRYFWNKRTADGYMRAIDSFQSAIRKDPSYALAYDGLGDSYALLGSMTNRFVPRRVALPRALAALRRALQIDENLAEAHASLGFIKMHDQWDWKGGEREFQRAIELNPGYATAHHWYAYELVGLGRFDEAIREIREAQKADPVSIIINADVAEILFFSRRYDEAIAQCRRTIDLDPNFALAHWILARAYRFNGQYAEAVMAAQKALEIDPDRIELLIELAANYRSDGRFAEADKAIGEWKKQVAGRYDAFFTGTNAALFVGNRDQVFTSLEKQYDEHSGSLILLNVEPDYAALRDDPRFKSLVHRLALGPPSHSR
jgi:TolB-like protein/Tfp pilus assembly protein PilF